MWFRVLVLSLSVFGFVGTFGLTACSVKSESQTPQPIPVPVQESGALEPVELTVESGGVASNTFSIAINQAQGKQDYFITQTSEMRLKLVVSAPRVVGCDANQVKVEHGWFEDASQTRGMKVVVGDVFYARGGRRGLFQVGFTGLTGCTRLDYSVGIQHVP